MKWIVAASIAGLGLSGCGTILGAKDALKERPKQPLSIAQKAEELKALSGQLGDVELELMRNGLPTCITNAPAPAAKGQKQDDDADAGPSVRCVLNTSQTVEKGRLDTVRFAYVGSSVAVINKQCAGYLESIANLGAGSRWSRSQFNTTANYLGVLLALSGESANTLGYLNAGSGFFNASADNLDSYILLSPSPLKITPLVKVAMRDKLQALAAIEQEPLNLRTAATLTWVTEYATLCTPRGIRLLLDAAIDNAAPTESSAELANLARNSADGIKAVLLAQIPTANASAWPDLTRAQTLGALVWFIRDQEKLTPDEREYINLVLPAAFMADVTSAMATPPVGATPSGKDRLRALVNSGYYDALIISAQNKAATAKAQSVARVAEAQIVALNDKVSRLQSDYDTQKARADAAEARANAASETAAGTGTP